jgi:hypothetical protein
MVTLNYTERKEDADFFVCFLSLASLNLISSVIFRVYRIMNSFYKKIVFFHLLFTSVSALTKLMYAVSINGIREQEGMNILLIGLKWTEIIFRRLSIGTMLGMVAVFVQLIYCTCKDQTMNLRMGKAVFGVILVLCLSMAVWVILDTDHLDVSRTYAVASVSHTTKLALSIFNAASVLFLTIALCYIGYMWRTYGDLFRKSQSMVKISTAYLQLIVSFYVFNLPFFIYIGLTAFNVTDPRIMQRLVGWKVLQGAVDAIIVYSLFFKKVDTIGSPNPGLHNRMGQEKEKSGHVI